MLFGKFRDFGLFNFPRMASVTDVIMSHDALNEMPEVVATQTAFYHMLAQKVQHARKVQLVKHVHGTLHDDLYAS